MKKRNNSKTKRLRAENKDLEEQIRIHKMKEGTMKMLVEDAQVEIIGLSAELRTAYDELERANSRAARHEEAHARQQRSCEDLKRKCDRLEALVLNFSKLAEIRGEEIAKMKKRGLLDRVLNK